MTVIRPLRPLDLRTHRHERLLYVCGILGTCFKEGDLKLVCKFLLRRERGGGREGEGGGGRGREAGREGGSHFDK